MAEETYRVDDRVVSTEFAGSKAAGVVGLVFVNGRGERIRVLFARDDIPAFIERLQDRYKSILD